MKAADTLYLGHLFMKRFGDFESAILHLTTTWEEAKNPIQIAKLAYEIYLDFGTIISDEALEVVESLMIMEADDNFILPNNEIEVLLLKLRKCKQTI